MDPKTREKLKKWADERRGRSYRDGGVIAALVEMFDGHEEFLKQRTARETELQHKLDLATQEVGSLKQANALLERMIDMVGSQKLVFGSGGIAPQQARFVWRVMHKGGHLMDFDRVSRESAISALCEHIKALRGRDVSFEELQAERYEVVRVVVSRNVWGPNEVPPGCYTKV